MVSAKVLFAEIASKSSCLTVINGYVSSERIVPSTAELNIIRIFYVVLRTEGILPPYESAESHIAAITLHSTNGV